MTRYVYDFDEPSDGGRDLLGGKGVGLAEMTQLGIPVPAGFTTEVWDRERDGADTRLVGPVRVALPVGVDFIARPFGEPLLFRIASAYEAETRHRRPPADFGPVAPPTKTAEK